MAVTNILNRIYNFPPDEQPECRIYFAPRAMRNREGVSHKAER